MARSTVSEVEKDGDDGLADALAMIRAASNQDLAEWRVKVYQVLSFPKDGISEPFVFNCGLGDLATLDEKLQDDYPEGGKFRVRVRSTTGIVKQFDIQVAPKRRQSVVAAPAQARDIDRTEAILQAMVEQGRQTQQLIAAMIQRMEHPSLPVNQTDQITQTLTLMRALNEAMPKAEPNIGLSMFERGMEMATKVYEMSGGGDKGSGGIMGLARDFLSSDMGKAAASALIAGAQQTQPQSQDAPSLAAPPAPNNPRRVQAEPPVMPARYSPEQVNAGMNFLISKAEAGADPTLFAEWIATNLPEELLQQLEAQDDILAFWESTFPKIGLHRKWFAALVAEIWDNPDNAAPQNGAGDGGNGDGFNSQVGNDNGP